MWIHWMLCLLASIFFEDVRGVTHNIQDDSRRTFPIKRAVDGTRGSKYFDVPADDAFDIYDAYDEEPDFSDYRGNIPGEPGLDYPSFTRIPQTSFTCEREYRGYYADEEAGCQLFHVCDGDFLVSSFLCPVGSTFSQKLLTCDWWNKVDCSATRNFYQVNNQIIIRQVDDDEILRKAYEMTSLQSTRNGVAVISLEDRFNNDLNRRLSHVNDLQNGGVSQYPDYQNPPSITVNKYPQFKYSSRYSSALDQHDRDIDFYPRPPDENKHSPIKVETIGNDYRNDNDGPFNRFESSYAPTVPTVTTTTRRYYSPTIPPIIRTTPKSRKYDLEFESSDHLYSARGKHPFSTSNSAAQPTTGRTETIKTTVTPPTLDTSTPFILDEFLSTVSDEKQSSVIHNETSSFGIPSPVYQAPVNDEKKTVSGDKPKLIQAFTTVEFQNSTNDSLIIHNENNTDFAERQEKSVVTNPSTEILPPFFYYSNVEQHDAVLGEAPEKLIFNLTANNYPAVASENVADRSKAEVNDESAGDTVDEESSPFQVTVTLKNDEEFYPNSDLLKDLIAQQDFSSKDQIRDIEIIKSEGYGKLNDFSKTPQIQINEQSTTEVSNYSARDSRKMKYLDIVPRPFSLRPQTSIDIDAVDSNRPITEIPEYFQSTTNIESSSIGLNAVTPLSSMLESSNATTYDDTPSVHSEKTEILQQLEQTFGQPLYKIHRQAIFDLPNRQRSVDFANGEPIHRDTQQEETEIARGQNTTDHEETKILVETELVPSLGFSLDTEEEREQYVDAVLRGLFKDINLSVVEAKSQNVSELN